MPQFIFRGQFSKGLNTQTIMSVTFEGREPVEVTDAPAVNWFDGHPEYERVAEEPVPEAPRRRIMAAKHIEALKPKAKKAPAKKAPAKKKPTKAKAKK